MVRRKRAASSASIGQSGATKRVTRSASRKDDEDNGESSMVVSNQTENDQQMVQDNTTSAKQKVLPECLFDILSHELFEAVLLQLSLADLYIARQVCRYWRDTVRNIEEHDKLFRFTCGSRGFGMPGWEQTEVNEPLEPIPNKLIDYPVEQLWVLSRFEEIMSDADGEDAGVAFTFPCTCGRVLVGRVQDRRISSSDTYDIHGKPVIDRWEVLYNGREEAFQICEVAKSVDARLLNFSLHSVASNRNPVPWFPIFIHLGETAVGTPRSKIDVARLMLHFMKDFQTEISVTEYGAENRAVEDFDSFFLENLVSQAVPERWSHEVRIAKTAIDIASNRSEFITTLLGGPRGQGACLIPFETFEDNELKIFLAEQIVAVANLQQAISTRLRHVVFASLQHGAHRRVEIAVGLSTNNHLVGVFSILNMSDDAE